jgi:N-acetylglucosamine kinase-like BadF-type ATPase
LIDEAMRLLTHGAAAMDRDGRMAAAGSVDQALLQVWLAHPFFRQLPPKSTGREQWGAREARQYVVQARERGLSPEDTIATLTALTAQSIAGAYRDFLGQVDEVLVAGGGARNPVLLDMLRAALPKSCVQPSDILGFDADAKEAVTFALLAYATVHGWPGNIPSATGAFQPAVLGSITPGANYRDLLRYVLAAPASPPLAARLRSRSMQASAAHLQIPAGTSTRSGLLLGIDGGGSKTRAVLADSSGTVLGAGVAGSSNYQVAGFTAATDAIWSAVDAAAADARLDPAALHTGKAGGPVAAVCLGLAGVGRPDDRARFEAWLREQAIAEHVTIVNDAELLLAAGTPDGWGMALVCGTGSICYGRAPGGTITRAGGWGYLLGDEGSGYDIGRRALRLATQTADGRAQAKRLLQAILDRWQLQEPAALVAHVYRGDVSRTEIAALAELVVVLAASGDSPAQEILRCAARELTRLAETVVARLQIPKPPLALGGGLLRTDSPLNSLVIAHIDRVAGSICYVDDATRGALVIARRMLDPSQTSGTRGTS